MNKSLLIITILVLTLFSQTPTSGMTINTLRKHPDIYNQITNRLSHNDRNDMRLVCKDWAATRPNWQLMPDSVEQKYDAIIKRNKNIKRVDRFCILFACTAQKNNFEAIQWIINTKNDFGNISFNYDKSKIILYPHMLAIHNNEPETARFLIEANADDKNQDWKNCYKTTTIPPFIEECLDTNGNKRDFSFLFYLTAIWLDNAHDLKKVYKQKKPTKQGQQLLIEQCLHHNALTCFKALLKHKHIKETIKESNIYFFKLAVGTYQEAFPHALIKNKLFAINGTITSKQTILDYYYKDKKLKKDTKAIEILINLGAKKWIDVPIQRTHHAIGVPC
jgi:hypothetical protein